jgi:hypothetical protein
MSGRMKNSLSCRMPSPFWSATATMPTALQFWIQARFITSATGLPMIEVARFGSSNCSFVSVARAGAVK